jgi:hypothetical protein
MMITFGVPGRLRPGSRPARALTGPLAGWDAAPVFDRFTARAREVAIRAQDAAMELAHPHVGTEHLLLGELEVAGGLGAWTLETLGLGREMAARALADRVPPSSTPPAGRVPFTAGARCALERAMIEVQSRGLGWVNTEHLLLGICDELDGAVAENDVARRTLAAFGVTTAQIRSVLDPFIQARVATLSWSLRRTPEPEFRDLPGSDWARLLSLRADLRLRRLLMDSAAVALDAGRYVVESRDLVVAAGVVPAVAVSRKGVPTPGVDRWERVEAGRPVLSALVGAGRLASTRRAEAVTVAHLLGSLRADQRGLLARAGCELESPTG